MNANSREAAKEFNIEALSSFVTDKEGCKHIVNNHTFFASSREPH